MTKMNTIEKVMMIIIGLGLGVFMAAMMTTVVIMGYEQFGFLAAVIGMICVMVLTFVVGMEIRDTIKRQWFD